MAEHAQFDGFGVALSRRWYNRRPSPFPSRARASCDAQAVVNPPSSSAGVQSVGISDDEYAQVRRRLAVAVARVCPRWLADRSEDIVQVAFTRVLAAVDAQTEADPLPASYLWKAAYSATIDEIRRLRRERGVSLDEVGADQIADRGGLSPERQRWGREIGVAIRACLRLLAEPRRLAVTLHLLGHSLVESSRLLGWSVKRVDNLVYRGLADLRGCLGSKGLTP